MSNATKLTCVYRSEKDGTVYVDGSVGTVLFKLLADPTKNLLRSAGKAKGFDLDLAVTSGDPFRLPLVGNEPPQWDYQGGGNREEELPPSEDGADVEPSEREPKNPNKQGKPDMGDGKLLDAPQQSDSEGNGEGADKNVTWGEFGPWAEQAVQAVGTIVTVLDAVDGDIDKLAVSQETLERRVAKLEKAPRGGSKDGGGAIVTVEILRPREPKKEQVGLHHRQFPLLLRMVAAGMHSFLPGPPGTGKSHAAEQVAAALDWGFGSISLGPTTPESRLWGGMDAHGVFHEPMFIKGGRHAMNNPDSGFVYCLDEMDNGHPGILATLNSAMANGWYTAPNGDVIRLGSNFVIVAAANTYGTGPTAEFSGRNRLDAATLDRFGYIPWDTDERMETALVKGFLAETENGDAVAREWLDVWRTCRRNVAEAGLRIFVTMRGAINGAKMLSIGMDVDTVLGTVLLNKLPPDQREKINPL